MKASSYDILNGVLPAIDPALCDYQEWVNVGFALKDGGYTWQDWDNWSRGDRARYHDGECQRKWLSMRSNGVTLGTLVQMARDQGWVPEDDPEAWQPVITSWDDIDRPLYVKPVIEAPDPQQLSPIDEPAEWHPGEQLKRYLELLEFRNDECVSYVTKVRQTDRGTWVPASQGTYTRTAGELLKAIDKYGDDLGAVIGDWNPESGAWIRFNPMDGEGVGNDNVKRFKWALVESDSQSIEEQLAIYRDLRLPARVIVHSGGKSLHAIVEIGAATYDQYRSRVNELYDICKANGLSIDRANRNPSRLSRLPGVTRNGRKQFIVAENTGCGNFEEWKDYIAGMNDDLPEIDSWAKVRDHLPELKDVLIEGILRKGHKMLIAGPSKAGKSFALIELAICFAEGKKWLGEFQCAQCRALYINLEVDGASALHRFDDVYRLIAPECRHPENVDVWNLRGHIVSLDRLAPIIARRAGQDKYDAIIIDPTYKVITGDENSASDMAKFCNLFDYIANKTNAGVIYCHHHSKGLQGQKKSMDRASGSGVFARDPDALLDMIELPVDAEMRAHISDMLGLRAAIRTMDALPASQRASWPADWRIACDIENVKDAEGLLASANSGTATASGRWVTDKGFEALKAAVDAAKAKAETVTAWRIEGTLREFAPFAPVDILFHYPIHIRDGGLLEKVRPESEMSWREKGKQARAEKQALEWQERRDLIEKALEKSGGEPVPFREIGFKAKERTAKDWFKDDELSDYELINEVDKSGRSLPSMVARRSDPQPPDADGEE